MFQFMAGLILLLSLSTHADSTCMAQCQQNEKDATVTTSCAAPGGPVRTTTEIYRDYCGDGSLIKYRCGGMAGMEYPTTELYSCKKCSDENTCEEVLFIIK